MTATNYMCSIILYFRYCYRLLCTFNFTFQQIYSTTVTVKNHKIGGGSPSHQAHAKTHAHTIPKVHGAESSYSPNMSHHKPGTMSSLSNNLSELDMLLQDLSSAQFMAEVDRRNNAGWFTAHCTMHVVL